MEQNNILRDKWQRFILLSILVIYIAILSYGLFFAESMDRTMFHGTYNMEPFREILRNLRYANELGLRFVAINLGGNILAFLPFGFLIAAFWHPDNRPHFLAVITLSVIFSIVVECLQYHTAVGVADVDDIILNTTGAAIGYEADIIIRRLLYSPCSRPISAKEPV